MKKGLGKGLGALLADAEGAYGKSNSMSSLFDITEEELQSVSEVSISELYPNPNQPRRNFSESALSELCESIKKHGVIMPIVITPKREDGRHMIIAGERRYRASILAGKNTIPAVVRDYDDREIYEIALIENLQREDLNPIEEALAMKSLMEGYSLTQEELAERLGKSRPAITNTIRLLSLCDEVLELVAGGQLSAGHARTLVTLDKEAQIRFAQEAIKEGISVREMEKRVRLFTTPPEVLAKKKEEKTKKTSAELTGIVERMRYSFKTKVGLVGNDKKGRITIDYLSRDDLERIIKILDLIDSNKI